MNFIEKHLFTILVLLLSTCLVYSKVLDLPKPIEEGSDPVLCNVTEEGEQTLRVVNPNGEGMFGVTAHWYTLEGDNLVEIASGSFEHTVPLQPGEIVPVLVRYKHPVYNDSDYQVLVAGSIQTTDYTVNLYANSKTQRICAGDIPLYWNFQTPASYTSYWNDINTLYELEILTEAELDNYKLFAHLVYPNAGSNNSRLTFGNFHNFSIGEATTQNAMIKPIYIGINDGSIAEGTKIKGSLPGVCEGTALNFALTSYECPSLNPAGIHYALHGSSILQVSNAGNFDHFQWKQGKEGGSELNVGNNQAQYTTQQEGVYWVEVWMEDENIISGISAIADIRKSSPLNSQNINYISTTTVLKEGIGETGQIQGLGMAEFMQNTVYYDGLGRAIQGVSAQASPTGKDLVQPIEYDEFGRNPQNYLPYVDNSQGDGLYKNDALTAQANFWNPSGDMSTADGWNSNYQRVQGITIQSSSIQQK